MKKRLLITGGSGTVGRAFIKEYRDTYDFYSIGRNEKLHFELARDFPEVKTYLCPIENKELLFTVYEKVNPEIVIHAAALKHVNIAERQPIQTCYVNIVGSLNVLAAATAYQVPVTVAISTDKACNFQNVYGMSKYLLERCCMEANTPNTKVLACRFANVAGSNGSVIPLWKSQAAQGLPLKITDPKMCRMMFSQQDAARLIGRGIEMSNESGGFVLSKLMKTVNMLRLAYAISENIEIIGSRPGEKLDEDLISSAELPFSKMLDNGYVKISSEVNTDILSRVTRSWSTQSADNMTNEEMLDIIAAS